MKGFILLPTFIQEKLNLYARQSETGNEDKRDATLVQINFST